MIQIDTKKKKKHPTSTFGPFWHISKSHKNFNIGHFETRIFAIRSSVPSEVIEVLKSKIYENGQLSCGLYSSPAAARSPLKGWVGDRCCDRSIIRIILRILRPNILRLGCYPWMITSMMQLIRYSRLHSTTEILEFRTIHTISMAIPYHLVLLFTWAYKNS